MKDKDKGKNASFTNHGHLVLIVFDERKKATFCSLWVSASKSNIFVTWCSNFLDK